MRSLLSRRQFCGFAASVSATSLLPVAFAQPKSGDRDGGLILGMGNYGMKSLKVEDAIHLIARLGFDGIELSVMPDWDSAPAKLNRERRTAVAQTIVEQGLTLTSFMEDLTPSANQTEHQTTLDRLKRAAELGLDLSPGKPPLIQTVLGGGRWDEKKDLFRDRLGDWLQIAESNKVILGIKPHRSGAMSQPSEAIWLINQLGNSPWLGMLYDYSHYAFRNLPIAETVKTAFPATMQIVVKDVINKNGQFEFALPGEANTIDHGEILTAFYERGFRKSVCCEVSSQVFRSPDYDAEQAAKACFRYLNSVFEKSKIPRKK